MKKNTILLILFLSLIYSENFFAQSNAAISKIIQKGQRVELTITASKPFYVGGNMHILHIGNKDFTHYKQTKKNGKGILTFLIPIEDFNSLVQGDVVWMSYGNLLKENPGENINIEEMCKTNPQKLWYFGKFSAKLLKK
ncbi:MAG: hypothetical protein NTX97_01660 [Bacteroidetes bacterium]|nr:hypothetical protein [Bacteroidota bacterium]